MKGLRGLAVLLISMVLALPAWATTDDDIRDILQGAADDVLARVADRREELEQHPERIHDTVADLVKPYFDFSAMTESAMGKYWPRSSDSQKAAVVAEFSELLIRTYGSAVFKYSGKPVEYGAMKWSSDGQRVLIPTKVAPVSGPSVPIDYKVHQVDGNWKIYDVVVDNVSLVTNYRSSFSNEIRSGGVEALIEKLRTRNQELRG